MIACSLTAARTLNVLTGGLDSRNSHREIDNAAGVFMPVVVEFVGHVGLGSSNDGLPLVFPTFAVSHYYEQNGDLMRDPDMVFMRAGAGRWYPLSFRQDGGVPRDDSVVDYNGFGEIVSYRPRLQRDMAVFTTGWMRNIRAQQGLALPSVKAVA